MGSTRVALGGLAACLAAVSCGSFGGPARPTLILWAWDRAEDLRFIKPGEAEVAGLVATWRVRGGEVDAWSRKLPLLVPDAIPLKAVVRIESDGSGLPPAESLEPRFREIFHDRFNGLQIDFDAKASQVGWYADVVGVARRRFGKVSVTAIASLCSGGAIPGLAERSDEVVPMLFRMGPQRTVWLNRFRRNGLPAECVGAVGIATDEPLPWIPPSRRVYVFHPKSWTEEAFRKVCERWR